MSIIYMVYTSHPYRVLLTDVRCPKCRSLKIIRNGFAEDKYVKKGFKDKKIPKRKCSNCNYHWRDYDNAINRY